MTTLTVIVIVLTILTIEVAFEPRIETRTDGWTCLLFGKNERKYIMLWKS